MEEEDATLSVRHRAPRREVNSGHKVLKAVFATKFNLTAIIILCDETEGTSVHAQLSWFAPLQEKAEEDDTLVDSSENVRESAYGIAIQFRQDPHSQSLRVNNIKKNGPAW
jgi:hypothetical protein